MTEKPGFPADFVQAVLQDTEQLPPREREGFKRLGDAVADNLYFLKQMPPAPTCFYLDGKPVLEIMHEGDVVLRLYDRDGHLAVQLFRDGTVKLALGTEIDEVVRSFWRVLAQLGPRPLNPKQDTIDRFCQKTGLSRDEFDREYFVVPVAYRHDGTMVDLEYVGWEVKKISDQQAVPLGGIR